MIVSVTTDVERWEAGQSVTDAGHAVMVDVRVVNTVEVVSSGGDDTEVEVPELPLEEEEVAEEAPDEIEPEPVIVDEPEAADVLDVTVAVPVELEPVVM